jgi:hypothetical protein
VWYGYVGPGIRGVQNDINVIRKLLAVYPYLKFRKKKTEEEAWAFVEREGKRPTLKRITKYGDIFNTHYVTVEYFIQDGSVFYNIFTKNIGYIRISSDDENVLIENRSELIKIELSNIHLNNEFISSHAIAIYHILRLLGSYVDVEILVPDHSIFYMLTAYTGTKSSLVRVLKYIESRKGNIAVTVKEKW